MCHVFWGVTFFCLRTITVVGSCWSLQGGKLEGVDVLLPAGYQPLSQPVGISVKKV